MLNAYLLHNIFDKELKLKTNILSYLSKKFTFEHEQTVLVYKVMSKKE